MPSTKKAKSKKPTPDKSSGSSLPKLNLPLPPPPGERYTDPITELHEWFGWDNSSARGQS